MFPKPAKGEYRAEKLARRGHEKYVETQAKQAAKARDGHRCRRPGCTSGKAWRLEAAHLEDSGMGGRHEGVSDHRRCYVTVCYRCHQGPGSIHTNDLRAVPLDPARGADGLVRWDELTEAGWKTIGLN